LIFLRAKLKNLWQAWKNVSKWRKVVVNARKNLKDTVSVYLTRLALKKWKNRTNMTVKCRAAIKKFKEKVRIIKLKAVFNSLKKRLDIENDLCIKMGNISSKFDNRMKEAAV
jgi:hypothetical protein